MMHGFGFYGRGFCPIGYGGYGFFGMWPLLILIGVVIVAVVLLFRRKRSHSHTTALETLKVMYAKGEITEEEYNQRKSTLQKK